MLKHLTYRQKYQYLLIGSGLFLLFLIYFNFSDTWQLYFKNKNLKQKIATAQQKPNNQALLELELAELSDRVKVYVEDSSNNQEMLLQTLTVYCNDKSLTLLELPQNYIVTKEKYTFSTSVFTARGDFISLLKLLYHIEYEKKMGRIASTLFSMEKDKTSHGKYLRMKVWVRKMIQTH